MARHRALIYRKKKKIQLRLPRQEKAIFRDKGRGNRGSFIAFEKAWHLIKRMLDRPYSYCDYQRTASAKYVRCSIRHVRCSIRQRTDWALQILHIICWVQKIQTYPWVNNGLLFILYKWEILNVLFCTTNIWKRFRISSIFLILRDKPKKPNNITTRDCNLEKSYYLFINSTPYTYKGFLLRYSVLGFNLWNLILLYLCKENWSMITPWFNPSIRINLLLNTLFFILIIRWQIEKRKLGFLPRTCSRVISSWNRTYNLP